MSERTCLLPDELPTCLPAYLSDQLASKTASQCAAWLRSELASQQTRRPANATESSTSVQRSSRSAAQNAVRPQPVDRLVQNIYASGRQAFLYTQIRTFVKAHRIVNQGKCCRRSHRKSLKSTGGLDGKGALASSELGARASPSHATVCGIGMARHKVCERAAIQR